MITIQGLSAVQRDIADRLWQLDTREDIESYIATLPRSLKREAWVVMNMIIWAELDDIEDITDATQDLIRRLG